MNSLESLTGAEKSSVNTHTRRFRQKSAYGTSEFFTGTSRMPQCQSVKACSDAKEKQSPPENLPRGLKYGHIAFSGLIDLRFRATDTHAALFD